MKKKKDYDDDDDDDDDDDEEEEEEEEEDEMLVLLQKLFLSAEISISLCSSCNVTRDFCCSHVWRRPHRLTFRHRFQRSVYRLQSDL